MKKPDIHIPVAVIGPGSQPPEADGEEMTFMDMPSGMTIFAGTIVPEPEDVVGMEEGIALGHDIAIALKNYKAGDDSVVFELDKLNDTNKSFIDQLLGDGEVSATCGGEINVEIQESVLAGLWRVRYLDDNMHIIRDTMEVGYVPSLISEMTFHDAAEILDTTKLNIPEDVYNAAPLLAEISDKMLNLGFSKHTSSLLAL